MASPVCRGTGLCAIVRGLFRKENRPLSGETATATQEPIGKILRGSIWLTVTSSISKILLLAFFVYMANRLGRNNLGRFQFLLDSAFMIFVCLDLGLGYLLVQKISRDRGATPGLMARFLGLRVCMTVPFLALYGLFLYFYHHSHRGMGWDAPQTLAMTYLGLMAVWDLFRSVLRGWERMDLEAISTLIERLIYMGAGTAFLWAGYRLGGMMLAAQLSIACSLVLIAWWVIRGGGSFRVRLDAAAWPALIRETLPFGLGALCIVVLYREDTVMLNWLKGDAETGLYSSAFRLMEGTLLVPQAVALAAYPTFSRIFHEGCALRPQAEKLQRWLLIFCFPLMAGGILLAPRVIGLFNEEYLLSTRVLQWLLLALPALYLNYLVGTLLRSVDRQTINLYSAAMALAVNFGMNLVLIPPLGARGAAIATVLTQFAYFGLMYFYLRGAVGSLRIRAYFLKLCLCTVVMAGALCPILSVPLYVSIPLGAAVFIGIALLTGLVRREEIQEFLGFLRKGGGS